MPCFYVLNNTFWLNVSINALAKCNPRFSQTLSTSAVSTSRQIKATHIHRAHTLMSCSPLVSITLVIILIVAEPVRCIPWRSKSQAAQRNIKLNFKSNGSHQSVNLKHYTLTHLSAQSLIQLKWKLLTSLGCLLLQKQPHNFLYMYLF